MVTECNTILIQIWMSELDGFSTMHIWNILLVLFNFRHNLHLTVLKCCTNLTFSQSLNIRQYDDIVHKNISQTMIKCFKPNQTGFNSQLVFKPNYVKLSSIKLTCLHLFVDLNQTKTVQIV